MLLFYGFVSLIVICQTLAQNEIPAKVVTLLSNASYVDYAPVAWNYTGDGSQLILPIRLRTRSIKGRLITLSVRGAQQAIFTLFAYIDNAAIVIELANKEGKLIKKTERQLPGANNGMEHSMSIHLNPQMKNLKVVHGQGTVDSYDFSEDIEVEDLMNISVTSGKYGDQESIIGCMTIVGLTVGGRFVFELGELKRDGPVKEGCGTLCVDGQCNKGTCIDLYHTAVCDCRGTYQSGEKCDEEMKTLNVSWDQYIAYNMSESESQPTIISIDFKTEVKEGLIIHGTVLSLYDGKPLGNLKLALIYGQLRLTVADLAEINFDNVTMNSENYNQILLEFGYGLDMVHMSFNGNTKTASWNTGEKHYRIRLGSELYFSAGDSEVGLSGCLRGIYVGHFDIIDGYAKGSGKVTASPGLQSCEGKDVAAAPSLASVLGVPINLPVLVREEEIQEKPLNEPVGLKNPEYGHEPKNEQDQELKQGAELNSIQEIEPGQETDSEHGQILGSELHQDAELDNVPEDDQEPESESTNGQESVPERSQETVPEHIQQPEPEYGQELEPERDEKFESEQIQQPVFEHGQELEPEHGYEPELEHGHKPEPELVHEDKEKITHDHDANEREKQIHLEQARLMVEENMQKAIAEVAMTKLIAEPPIKQLCENDEATSCKNSIECVIERGSPICVCRKGFVGKYCQFSVLPWNCDDVLRQGNTVPGTYIIDTDGSGPLPESYAYCDNGRTIISHNMPNNTLIHSKELGNIRMVINYKLFNDELLQSLKYNSESCGQSAEYHCRSAPLAFKTKKTWFSSKPGKFFFGFGGKGGTCPCTNNYCMRCNCDTGGIEHDYAFFQDEEVPLRSIYSMNDPMDYKGNFTLSPLICSGSAGHSPQYTMGIRNRHSPISVGEWTAKSLSFEFRTYLENATLLSSKKVEISMADRSLHLAFDDQMNLTLTPQSRKNDGQWHRIILDIFGGSVRFSVDDTVETKEIKELSFTKTELDVGGGKYGFSGCIRQLIIDGRLKAADTNLQSYCENKCETYDCQHESRCEEDFTLDRVICVCKSDILHSGDLCQNSINYGTEISFHDAKRAFLKIQNPSVEEALLQRIVFSFRTDRRDALLIFLHDQLYNFVQVHLSEHSHMILTLNFNRTVRRCEVIAKVGHEFSRMRWIQVMVFQWSDRTELNVDDEICQISGRRIISTDFIKQFNISSDIDDVVEPPVSPVVVESAGHKHPYVLLFVGGLPTSNYLGSLDPIYQSSVSNLLGCLRGLMLGAQILNMRDRSYWSHYPTESDMIRDGCETGCHKTEYLCKNGGHCAVEWTAKYVDEDVRCNCVRTSYYGEYCDQDSGAYFSGNSLLVFNVGEIFEKVIYDWSEVGEHTFNFAFSTSTNVNSSKPQVLATVHFQRHRAMEIVLCKNGSLNIGIMSKDASYVYTFPYNYSDGYRHFLQSKFRGRKPLKITVDSWQHVFPLGLSIGLSLADASKFIFGGSGIMYDQEQIPNAGKMLKNNYTGCISNIEINMKVGRMHFKPIQYLQSPKDEFAESTTVHGDILQLGVCNSFLIPGSLPPVLNIVNSPVWDSPFIVEPYILQPGDNTNQERSEGSSKGWIVLLIILLLLLIMSIIFMLLYFLKKRKRQLTPPPTDPDHKEEHLSLLPDDQKDPNLTFQIKDDFDLPEPDQHLGQNKTPMTQTSVDIHPVVPVHGTAPQPAADQQQSSPSENRVSADSSVSGVTSYFTANTDIDSGDDDIVDEDLARAPQASGDDVDLDDTLMDYEEEDELVPSREDMHRIDRSAPERMSSFKRGDPTAPHDSPLYKPQVQRKPKPVPPPRSPVTQTVNLHT